MINTCWTPQEVYWQSRKIVLKGNFKQFEEEFEAWEKKTAISGLSKADKVAPQEPVRVVPVRYLWTPEKVYDRFKLIDPQKIINKVCQHFSVSHEKIKRQSKERRMTLIRYVLVELLIQRTLLTQEEIGIIVGRNRDVCSGRQKKITNWYEFENILSSL